MRALILALSLIISAFTTATYVDAREWMTPKRGSSERKAIMNAMRPAVARQLNAPIQFVVKELRVYDDWAFAQVVPQRPGGKPIDLRNTPLKDDAEMMDGVRTEVFLRRKKGRWKVVDHAIGATDVWYEGYCNKAPRALMEGFCPAN